MLGKLTALFDTAFARDNEDPAAREHALRVATALLLIEVARADYADDFVEEAAMLDSLKQFFALDDSSAALLLEEARSKADQAVELARKDDRISASIQGLEGHAILMQPGDGIIFNDPGYGHRVFWVTFSQGVSGNPEYWAVVDLSERKVLKADKEESHP